VAAERLKALNARQESNRAIDMMREQTQAEVEVLREKRYLIEAQNRLALSQLALEQERKEKELWRQVIE